MPGTRRTSSRRRQPRQHYYRGVPSARYTAEEPRRSVSWDQWVEGWELPVYTPEQAQEAHLVTIAQIADRYRKTMSHIARLLKDHPRAPSPLGKLCSDAQTSRSLLFSSRAITRWVRLARPWWVSETPTQKDEAMTQYRTLTRGELTVFDQEPTKMILDAMEAGVLGNVSRKSHAILRNAAGSTMSIPRKMALANRSAQNCRADYKRFMTAHQEWVDSHAVRVQPSAAPAAQATPEDTWFCTLCQDPFPVSEKDGHMEARHPKYMFCDWVTDGVVCGALVQKRGIGPHKNLAHKRSKAQRQAAAKKAAETRERQWREQGKFGRHLRPEDTPAEGQGEALEALEEVAGPPGPSPAELVSEASQPVAEPKLEKELPPAVYFDPLHPIEDARNIVLQIRNLLGQDPRIAELEAQIVALTEERDEVIKKYEDLEAKFALAKELFGI